MQTLRLFTDVIRNPVITSFSLHIETNSTVLSRSGYRGNYQ